LHSKNFVVVYRRTKFSSDLVYTLLKLQNPVWFPSQLDASAMILFGIHSPNPFLTRLHYSHTYITVKFMSRRVAIRTTTRCFLKGIAGCSPMDASGGQLMFYGEMYL